MYSLRGVLLAAAERRGEGGGGEALRGGRLALRRVAQRHRDAALPDLEPVHFEHRLRRALLPQGRGNRQLENKHSPHSHEKDLLFGRDQVVRHSLSCVRG